ncbi:MAG TPA: FHA domain-containing protein [Acidimicrobiia bacterium]|nr:FHA domain-containing protein [Acidimicrobiia bacterium]HIL06743.1 FHA domain-containing protein [Acidimicrobiia bacterium]
MSPQLVRLLTILLLVLIHLFFFRVIRAVWVGVRPVKQNLPRKNRFVRNDRPPRVLVVRTPETLRGQRHNLAEELTIGRAATCDVTIDDTYASQIHARVFRRDNEQVLEDLGSTNGTYLNRQKVASATNLKTGDHLQIGSTVFEVTA